ncbi:phage terminase small subunit [Sphingobium sp. BYY-5]|uniref:phage terminase small subunit n=1 Tax=Sphingobium sp. BYY-5 TaxID=2926400 RepID=UPI001FA6FD9B|nr:phage terminase small subunit [Sphingobium sp. BYY-5]MCI4588625.1 phage terminase small subunit [Sphingobium sp. BYY-5]
MSLARRHRERILAAQTITAAFAPAHGGATVPAAAPLPAAGTAKPSPADIAARQMGLRLTHDLRRLKEIRSIDMKIAAKREMLPEYRPWVQGIIAADAGVGTGLAAEVVPTCMVWLIDVGDYDNAISLAEFVMRHRVAMPARYQRDAATILIEEIADAAIKAQGANESFSLATLEEVADLTGHLDIHDQVRAKLLKAIGVEQLDRGESLVAEEGKPVLQQALASLTEAQRLHDRIGVKDRIKRAIKLLAAIPAAAPDPNTEQGGDSAA